jgi:uncharacterized protein (TIGR03437 family)
VVYQGNASAPFQIAISAVKPGIFTNDSSGSGQGAILNQDYSVNGPAQPCPARTVCHHLWDRRRSDHAPRHGRPRVRYRWHAIAEGGGFVLATIGGQPATVAIVAKRPASPPASCR